MSMVNEQLIQKYKNDKVIIKTYYQAKQKNGKLADIDGVVNPLHIDNRQLVSPTDNQHDVPACAGFSACTLIETLFWKSTGHLLQLDAQQVYARAKTIDGSRDQEGTYLEHALQAALSLCDFDFLKNAKIKLFYNDKTDSTVELTKFLVHKHDILQAGFMIDEGWYDVTSKDYVIKSRGVQLGGHAVFICGYDQQGVYIGNQWGREWGAKGFAVMPWPLYLKQLMYGACLQLA